MFFPHRRHASALTASTHCAGHQMSYKQPFNAASWSWLGGSLSSSPQTDGSHAFPSGQWRHQVLLAQELQGEVNQQPSDGFQLLRCLLWVCVAEALLCGVLLQLTQVVDSVIGQALEDLCCGGTTTQTEREKGEKLRPYNSRQDIYGVVHTLSYMVAFSLADAFQVWKKNSSLIGSSTLMLGSERAPTRTLENK